MSFVCTARQRQGPDTQSQYAHSICVGWDVEVVTQSAIWTAGEGGTDARVTRGGRLVRECVREIGRTSDEKNSNGDCKTCCTVGTSIRTIL